MKKGRRKMKVYSKFQPRENQYISIPEIRLSGKWLAESGFDFGQEISIKIEYKKLTITLL